VALICNLVQEFNGLVSKGSTAMLAFLLLKKASIFGHFFPLFFYFFCLKKCALQRELFFKSLPLIIILFLNTSAFKTPGKFIFIF
jgi:hypothetical protein